MLSSAHHATGCKYAVQRSISNCMGLDCCASRYSLRYATFSSNADSVNILEVRSGALRHLILANRKKQWLNILAVDLDLMM
jgi:hypothetical protein